MFRDDPEAVDRFDHALDALAGGSPPTAPWLDATDLRLRTLDTAFAPAEGVLMSIWDGLAENATAPVVNGVALNGSVAQAPPRDWRIVSRLLGRHADVAGGAAFGPGGHIGPPLRDNAAAGHRWWPRRWSVGAVSTVALLFLVVVAGYAAIQLAGLGDSDDGEGGPAGITVASPSPNELIVPPPSECTVEPRPASFFEQFVTTPTAAEDPTFPVTTSSFDPDDLAAIEVESTNGDVVISGGVAADDETVAAITSTVREFVACGNAGDGARTNALATEEFVRRVTVGSGGIPAHVLAAFTASPTQRDPDDWEGLYPIQDARLLDNGHVAAILPVPRDLPNGDSEIEYILLIFANTGNRWLIDGLSDVSELDVPPAIGERLVPSPEECTVEPLTWQEIEEIAATQTADSSSPRQTLAIAPALWRELDLRREAGLLQISGGDPADAATIAAVQHVLNTYFACLNARDFARVVALYSEEIIGTFGTVAGEDEASLRAELEATPTPASPEQLIGFYPVISARVLSTGHVVLLQPVDVRMFSSFADESIAYDPDLTADPYLLISFVKDGDRWRIDSYQVRDARELLEQPSLFPEQPTAEPTPTPAMIQTVAVLDPTIGAMPIPTPTITSSGAIFVEPTTVEVVVQQTPTLVFMPTHRSNAQNLVNLRSGPGTETRIVTTLTIAQPLHYLNEDAPTDDPDKDGTHWMKFRTENGAIGWVREIDVELIDAPTPTPVG